LQTKGEWFFFVLMGTSIVVSQLVLFSYSLLGSYLTDQVKSYFLDFKTIIKKSKYFQCEQIGYQAYQLEWPGKSLNAQRAIAFIIMRAQRPQKITSGKFSVINLENYGVVLHTSYSYVALLRSVFP
jgi:hypothetical protein